MKKIIKQLIIWYLLFVIIKSIIFYFTPAPSAFSDSYIYTKAARSFFHYLSFNVNGLVSHYPPLYSITISPAFIFNNMQIVYPVIKVINAAISSLIIFPSWLIAKEFLSNKKALFISILISFIPSNFSFTGYIMAENLFYPLFLFSIYFTYKSFTTEDLKYNLLAGIFIGLSFLTKVLGLILFALVILMILITFKKRNLLIPLIGLIVILPWSIRNILFFGFSFNGVLGGYASQSTSLLTSAGIFSFITWIFLYLGFIILASGVLFPITSINFLKKSFKDKNRKIFTLIFFISIGLYLLVVSKLNVTIPLYESLFNWLTSRPVGRYVDVLLPLIFISGFVGFCDSSKINRYFLLVISLILAFSSQLIFFPLFPVNNLSLTWLGIISHLSKSIFIITIFLFSLPYTLYLIYKRVNKNTILNFFLFFFLILNITNYTINYVDAKTYWYDGEQMQLGLWINDNLPRYTTVIFDERDCVKSISKTQQDLCSRPFIPMGFWMNNDIIIGNVLNPIEEGDYVISKHKLDYQIVKTSNNINIYKVK